MKVIGWPFCDICKKGVERILQYPDINEWRTTVVCHGKTETVVIDYYDLYDSPNSSIEFGIAFKQTKQLENKIIQK